MGDQLRIYQKLIEDAKFRIIVPANAQQNLRDVDSIKTREWLVPGEKTIILIEVKNCLNPLDAFSFYCTVTDAEHSIQETILEDQVPMTSLVPNYSLPNAQNFRKDDGSMYFPIRVTVPLSRSKNFIISAFCFRGSNPVVTLKCASFLPFTIYRSLHFTPQSMIVSFNIDCHFPETWNGAVTLVSSTLRFNEKIVSETDFSQNIAIIATNDLSCQVLDSDTIAISFALKPLNDAGGARMSNLPLVLHLSWRADGNDFTSVFKVNTGSQYSDLVITAPSAKAQLLRSSHMPITVTSVAQNKYVEAVQYPRTVTLKFAAGKIQPMAGNVVLEFTSEERVKTVDFSFIPLTSGQHMLEVTAEAEGRILRPLFPIYIDVTKAD